MSIYSLYGIIEYIRVSHKKYVNIFCIDHMIKTKCTLYIKIVLTSLILLIEHALAIRLFLSVET